MRNDEKFNRWASEFLSIKRTRKQSYWFNVITIILAVIIILLIMTQRTYAGDLKLVSATGYCCGTHGSHGDRMEEGYCAYRPEDYGKILAVYEAIQHDDEFKIGDFIGYLEVKDTGYGKSTGIGQSKIIEGKKIGSIESGKQIDCYFPTYAECQKFMNETQGYVYIMEVAGNG